MARGRGAEIRAVITELRIASLGVIEESVLELGPGLSVITGETGAGKTMLVTALGLLLGGRADSGAVRSGARQARVEGRFLLPAEHAGLVQDHGAEVEDGEVLLVRQVSAEGRSRAYAGGAAVPAGVLSDLAEALVAVHGQSDQHRLLRVEAQREALDRFAGVQDLRAEYASGFHRLREIEAELRELIEHARERAREADLLRHGLAEIEELEPIAGEEDALAADERRLGFADTLRTAAEEAREALSAEHGGPDALGAVGAARRLLDGVREHDPQVAGLADRLAELSYLLSDLAGDVAGYASGVETDPVRLAAISERRAALSGLTRKYGETVAEVLGWAETAAQRLIGLEGSDDRIAALRTEREGLRADLAVLAGRLSKARQQAAERLAAVVTDELTELAMPHASIRIQVTRTPAPDGLEIDGEHWRFGASGVDEVELLLAANAGAEARPLAKGASGGELSRVMLALEVALAGTSPVPTFVFDEVDAGVGGKAAVEVGRRLAMLAKSAQVLVVTHLPQVAAYAQQHVVVRKSSDGLVTTSDLQVLSDDERVRELSRMLAGMEESANAVAHAEELLAAARDGVS